MSVTLQVQKTFAFGGKTFAEQASITGDTGLVLELSLPAAKEGQLTTRTDNDTGELTMDAGHGIQTGDFVDIYWNGGSRRGVTVGTVVTNAVPIDLGAGDNLPTNMTDVTVMVRVQRELVFAPADCKAIVVSCEGRAHVTFSDDTGAAANDLYDFDLFKAAQADIWYADSGKSNPLDGASPTHVFLSHGETSAKVIRVGVLIVE